MLQGNNIGCQRQRHSVDKHVMEKTYKNKYALSCVLDCPQVE